MEQTIRWQVQTTLWAGLAVQFPAGFPAFFPRRKVVPIVFAGLPTDDFGSSLGQGLQPKRAQFPLGNVPDLRRSCSSPHPHLLVLSSRTLPPKAAAAAGRLHLHRQPPRDFLQESQSRVLLRR
uniref:Uncharacterized protein n=1 Tax=Setaria viridis TaxID=4556 RepID=A0A4U6TEP6_SETVI|nr:hypothetical protein SEVIR_8G080700v2 [Setaria viridis]